MVYSLFLHWKLRPNHNSDITFSLCRASMNITSDETVVRNVFIPFVLPTNLVNALSYKPCRGENRIHSIHSFIHLPGVFNSPLLHRIVRMHIHRAIRIVPHDQAPSTPHVPSLTRNTLRDLHDRRGQHAYDREQQRRSGIPASDPRLNS